MMGVHSHHVGVHHAAHHHHRGVVQLALGLAGLGLGFLLKERSVVGVGGTLVAHHSVHTHHVRVHHHHVGVHHHVRVHHHHHGVVHAVHAHHHGVPHLALGGLRLLFKENQLLFGLEEVVSGGKGNKGEADKGGHTHSLFLFFLFFLLSPC